MHHANVKHMLASVYNKSSQTLESVRKALPLQHLDLDHERQARMKVVVATATKVRTTPKLPQRKGRRQVLQLEETRKARRGPLKDRPPQYRSRNESQRRHRLEVGEEVVGLERVNHDKSRTMTTTKCQTRRTLIILFHFKM